MSPVATVCASTTRWRVVIIDDTCDLRDLLRLALERHGFEVVGEAGDGSSGIAAVKVHDPDIVLLDLAMPVMDGLTALPAIRGWAPRSTIVVLTGFGENETAARAIGAGADSYIQKGVSLASIVDTVSRAVTARRRQAEHHVDPGVRSA